MPTTLSAHPKPYPQPPPCSVTGDLAAAAPLPSPYLHTAHEGGRAAPNRSEQQLPDPDREGPQIVTFLRPLNPLCRPTPQLPGRRAGREEPPPRSTRTGRARGSMAKLYMQAVPPLDLNKNTEWFMYLGVWTTHIFILFVSWLLILSIFGCTPSMAWTLVNLGHFAITYHFFHWKKGTPFADDQGMYNRLTWWEQMDNDKQLTRNRKFLVVVPVVL
ncbi:uncharacterized protein [Aegilops tauschii subsp. strangulata]